MKLTVKTGAESVELEADPEEAAAFVAALGKEAGQSATPAAVAASSSPAPRVAPMWWSSMCLEDQRAVLCLLCLLENPAGVSGATLSKEIGLKSSRALGGWWKTMEKRLARHLEDYKVRLLLKGKRPKASQPVMWKLINDPRARDLCQQLVGYRPVEEILDGATCSR